MGKGGTPKIEVTEYRLSVHIGVCAKADRITAMYADDKLFWSGDVAENAVLTIDRPDLFGGPKEEGGFNGEVHVLMGSDSQVLSPYLQEILINSNPTITSVPGFRGLTSLFFTGIQGVRRGFYWTANQPYIKPVSVTVAHRPPYLNQTIVEFPDGTVNPVHVIYEAMVDPELGMGTPAEKFDTASWEAAAQTIWDEGIGVALQWVNQSSVEEIVNDMQAHINATVFQHPRTGLFTIKLIRGDYDPDTVREITPDDAILTNFQRKGLGETINEIVVTWTNPENEQEETVTVHDLGNISAQGQIVSDSRNYYGIRNAELATQLAQRDIRVAAAPLCSCDAVLDRRFWDVVPGEVIALTWPDYGLERLIMRVGKVDYGMPGDQAIKVNLFEDVFALQGGAYTAAAKSAWRSPSQPPSRILEAAVFTLPTYFLANLLPNADIEYPEVRLGMIAVPQGDDSFSYEVWSNLPNPAGDLQWTYVTELPAIGRLRLQDAIVAEPTTVIADLSPLNGTTEPVVGGFVWIGAANLIGEDSFGDDGYDKFGTRRAELCLITGYNPTVGWTLRRGILDTTPCAWPALTPIWVFDESTPVADLDTIRSQGERAEFQLLAKTSQGKYSLGVVSNITRYDVGARPHRPLRPANVRIEGSPWGQGVTIPQNGSATFTWANRNRITETARILAWTETSVTPEEGNITFVDLFGRIDNINLSDQTVNAFAEGTATSLTFQYSDLLAVAINRPGVGHALANGTIGWSMYCERDGLTSYAGVDGTLQVELPPMVRFVREGNQAFNISASSLSVTIPSLSDVDGQTSLLIMAVTHTSDLTVPSGWTELISVFSSETPFEQRLTVLTKDVLEPTDSGATTTWLQEEAGVFVAQAVLFSTSRADNKPHVVEIGTQTAIEGLEQVDVSPLIATSDGECFVIFGSFSSDEHGAGRFDYGEYSGSSSPTADTFLRTTGDPFALEDRITLCGGFRYANTDDVCDGVIESNAGSNETMYGGASITIRLELAAPPAGYGLNYGKAYG